MRMFDEQLQCDKKEEHNCRLKGIALFMDGRSLEVLPVDGYVLPPGSEAVRLSIPVAEAGSGPLWEMRCWIRWDYILLHQANFLFTRQMYRIPSNKLDEVFKENKYSLLI